MSLINKTSIANIMAGFIIVTGVTSFFLGIPTNDIMSLLIGAGIGYLFKNGIEKKINVENVNTA